jgi:hypothetical protein
MRTYGTGIVEMFVVVLFPHIFFCLKTGTIQRLQESEATWPDFHLHYIGS